MDFNNFKEQSTRANLHLKKLSVVSNMRNFYTEGSDQDDLLHGNALNMLIEEKINDVINEKVEIVVA
jgi:hypothetical protein